MLYLDLSRFKDGDIIILIEKNKREESISECAEIICRGDGGDLGHYFCIFILIDIFCLLVVIQIFPPPPPPPITNIDRILEEKGNVNNHL